MCGIYEDQRWKKSIGCNECTSGILWGSRGTSFPSRIGKEDVRGGVVGLSLLAKDRKSLSEKLGIGEMTLNDIIKELEKPGRDPRDEMPKPVLRTDVLEMKDLKEGMILKGTVRNVIDFGAFCRHRVHRTAWYMFPN